MTDKVRNMRTWNAIGQQTTEICRDLRGKLLAYCKVENRQKRNLLMMDLVRRNECNLFAVLILIKASLKNGTTYLKLPVGLLLRSCFADCIMGLYVSILSKDEAKQFAQTLNEEYVASLFSRAEVYKDKVQNVLPYDDEILEGWYTMQIEDNYLHYLALNPEETNMNLCTIWKVEKTGKHVTLDKMVKAIKKSDELKILGKQLYAYYKYFLQYEHFSEAAHGDALVDFGLDNVSYEKAIEALRRGIRMILDRV